MSIKKRFEGRDAWEKINGNKRLLGLLAVVIGGVLTCIPATNAVGTVILGSGLSTIGLGQIHANHKKKNGG